MDTHSILKILGILVDIMLITMLISDYFRIKKLEHRLEIQDTILNLQHIYIQMTKQEKCYGSTSDSKPESQGSTPCSCATICKELNK